MCAEDGVVFDDGVTGRLGPEHYVMSTTSSGAGAVLDLIENVLAVDHPEWAVHVTAVTGDYASINIAGPALPRTPGPAGDRRRPRPRGVPLHARPDAPRSPASTDCFAWRIGFTGELSYEIHVPAAYGLHVWEALLDGRAPTSASRPFGVEAQRIMRLEKGHLIVGQDTDGLTQALAAGLGWLVKLDKDDFFGRTELVWEQDARRPAAPRRPPARRPGDRPARGVPDRRRTTGSSGGSPPAGCPRPSAGRSASASSRPSCSTPGTVVTVRLEDGTPRPRRRVMAHHAHYDPDGSRLRG